jgi:hypothetical protein
MKGKSFILCFERLRVEGDGRVGIRGNLGDTAGEQNEKSNEELHAGQNICGEEMEEPW